MALLLQLKHGVERQREGADLLLIDGCHRCLRVREAVDSLLLLIERLAAGGETFDGLMQQFSLNSFLHLSMLEQRGFITLSVRGDQGSVLTLSPTSARLERQHPPAEPFQMRWSQHLQITPTRQGLQLEVPLRGSRLLLQDRRLAALLWDLATPLSGSAWAARLPQDLHSQSEDLLELLFTSGVVGVDDDGQLSCDREADRQRWSREDLALHHRSRQGWHEQLIGATFPGATVEPAQPLQADLPQVDRIDLPKPDVNEPDPGFFSVVERRASIRHPGGEPISINQLGRLLWASLSIRRSMQAYPNTPRAIEVGTRPVACGGALQEIDAFLTIRRCKGLEPGLYRYDGIRHQLLRLDRLNDACHQLLQLACQSSGSSEQPDILVHLAARYGRVSWKYVGLPYALILKHAGVVMQQLYLVATALDLAPCGLGSGNSELFARATKMNPYSVPSVAEFMLSGKDS